jgi:hypothetical protein
VPATLQNPEIDTRGNEKMHAMTPRQRLHRRVGVWNLVILCGLVFVLTVFGFVLRTIIDGIWHDLFVNITAALIAIQAAVMVTRWYSQDG